MVKDAVTSKQISHTAAVFIISTSLLVKNVYIYTKNDAWFAVLAGYLLSLLMMALNGIFAKYIPGSSLIEKHDAVYGPIIGKFVSTLYIFYFLTIACLNTNVITNFINGFVLPNTPIVIITFIFLLVCAWAVRKGAVNLIKYSTLFSFVAIIAIIINSLLMINDVHLEKLQPVLTLPLKNYICGIHTITVLPLSDPLVLMMFLPDMQNPAEFGKALSKGVTIGTVVLLFVILRDIATLGPGINALTNPTFSAIRNINIGDILTRMDIIYISVLISLMFYKVTVLYYTSVSGIRRIMKFDEGKFLIYIFGVLVLIYSVSVFKSSSEHAEWLFNGAASMFQTLFLVILPVITLLIAVFRGFFRKVKLSDT